jgi:FkbH-like protein
MMSEILSVIKASIARKDFETAAKDIRRALDCELDFTTISRLRRFVGAIPAELRGKPLRIAMLGSATLDHLADALSVYLMREGFDVTIWIAPFDTVVSTVMDTRGELYAFAPDIVWLFSTWRDVRLSVAPGDDGAIDGAIAQAVAARTALWSAIQAACPATILDNNADIPAIDIMGNFAGSVAWSQRNLLRRYNLALAAAAGAGVIIFDLDHLAGEWGRRNWIDWRYWFHSKHPVSFDAQIAIAFQAARVIGAQRGTARKCLVLDLDNTVWGGVIGDDGIEGIRLGFDADGEAFAAMQHFARGLKERGIILAVCSKNDHDIAMNAFANHPEMVLKPGDIAVFRANWENKADNIRAIAETLNIGMDAIVFADDNPVERNLVRYHLPMVAVPELPADPADYVATIVSQRYFETVSFSQEDRARGQFYADNAQRSAAIGTFTNQDEYLQTLDQIATVGDFDSVNLARMAQLVNKSNQFNLTTQRYSEADLAAIAAHPGNRVRHYRLADRYGDNGLIAVVVLRAVDGATLDIDLWVMSCRVLARTMEAFIRNDIVALAQAAGCSRITARYLPTAKNGMVATLYERLGFAPDGPIENGPIENGLPGASRWSLVLAGVDPLPCHIRAAVLATPQMEPLA